MRTASSATVWVLLACVALVATGCAAVEQRLDAEGKHGCLDCEAKCWPPGRICWTNKCLCEPYEEECLRTKLPICSPCDRQLKREEEAREAAKKAAEAAAEAEAAIKWGTPAPPAPPKPSGDVPETSGATP